MTLYAFIVWNCLAMSWATQPCLTGTMTDVQTWVDQEGRLILSRGTALQSTALDLSKSANPVSVLQGVLMTRLANFRRPLRYLSMAQCKLRQVPEVFDFQNTINSSLSDTIEYLSFYGNQFADFHARADRYDGYINATQASTLPIGLRFDTRVAAVWPGGFEEVRFSKLKELDLRACAINTLSGGIFRGMKRLEALYLSENCIIFINANAFDGLISLTHLDLSRNSDYDGFGNHRSLVLDSEDVMKDMKNLVSLDFSHTRLSQGDLRMFRHLGKKFERLSLCETRLTRLRDDFFEKTSLKYLDISGNNGILNQFNPLAAIESTLEVLYATQIGLDNFDIFQGFKRLEILNLQKNELIYIRPEVTKTLESLRVLDLDSNRINSWFMPIFSNMNSLIYLSLRNNNINMINEQMIEDFTTVGYVGISGNFVICNCLTRELFELALKAELVENANKTITLLTVKNEEIRYNYHTGFREYNNVILNRRNVSKSCHKDYDCDSQIYDNETVASFLLFDYDPKMYQCMQMAEGKDVSYSKVLNCNQSRRDIDYDDVIEEGWNYVLALIVTPSILFPILGIAVCMFRKNFRYFCITVRNSALLTLINKDSVIDESRIFNYDVFVSYCNEDRNWILDQLLPHLETTCGVSVCLHERDFQVGLTILENIVSCMDRSRTIMLIISRQFLLSQWCQFEMHLAQHRLLETRREDLILVLLEDIPRRLRPTTLHYLMLTKTYIVYPENGEGARKDFWKRLGRSVVSKRPDNENDSLA